MPTKPMQTTPVSPTPSYSTQYSHPTSPSSFAGSNPASPTWSHYSHDNGSYAGSPISPYSVHSYTTDMTTSSYSAYGGDREDMAYEQMSPNQKVRSMLEQSAAESDRTSSQYISGKTKLRREHTSQLKALAMLDEAVVKGGYDSPLANDGKDEMKYLKSPVDAARELSANCRALNLLDDTVGAKSQPDDGNSSKKHSEDNDFYYRRYREKAESANDAEFYDHMRRSVEERVSAKNEDKTKLEDSDDDEDDKEKDDNARSRTAYDFPRAEALAESTRKKKPATAESIRDPETVAGMKCKLDWDREKYAKSKALRLLNRGFIS